MHYYPTLRDNSSTPALQVFKTVERLAAALLTWSTDVDMFCISQLRTLPPGTTREWSLSGHKHHLLKCDDLQRELTLATLVFMMSYLTEHKTSSSF
jgi:hypothetical protein